MAIKKDVLDQLLAGRDPAKVFADGGLVDELKKALANRADELLEQRLGEIIRGRTVWRQQKVAEGVVVQAIFLLDWWQLYAAS